MERVTGIGGIFFKARDPQRTLAWYREHLGIPVPEGETYCDFPWRGADTDKTPGRTAWAVFEKDSDYFGPSAQTFMLNFRVANMDAMLAQLRRANIPILKTEDHDYGRFAWIDDPEGNRIELWEPR
jgi:catechol 2,3-dioxygenase-like lactoylglutathione lyase family enzyme